MKQLNTVWRQLHWCLLLIIFGTSAAILPQQGHAQGALDLEVSGDFKDITLIEVFLDLESRYTPLKFYYDPSVLPYYKVNYKIENKPLFNMMQNVLPQNGLTCITTGQYGVVVLRKTDINREYITNLLQRWNTGKIDLPEFLQPYEIKAETGAPPMAKQPVVVELSVFDQLTRESVPGITAKVIVTDSSNYKGSRGGTSNGFGKIQLTLQPGTHDIKLDYPGYREVNLTVQVYQAGSVDIPMQQRLQNLQEVVIQGNIAADRINSTTTGVEALSTQRIKEIPALMGEADVVKSLATLAGISTVGDGAAGFNVRGGNIDQNLVQQDGLVIYNTSHVLGFFSTFNPDLVSNTTLYKGHIPAQYGGRISSVLDVQLKNPNFQKWHGLVGLGVTNAKVMLEGPLVRNRVAVLLGARRSYSDWLLKTAKLPDIKQSSAWFGDATGKISILLNSKGSLDIGGHYSSDYFRFGREFGYAWDTRGLTATYRQALSETLIFSTNYSLGRTANTYFAPDGTEAFNLTTQMLTQRARAQVTLLGFDDHNIKAGVEWSSLAAKPQILAPRGDQSSIAEKKIEQDRGEELSAFMEDDWQVASRLTLNIGLRYTAFRQLGPGNEFEYEPGNAMTQNTIIDTVEWASGATQQRYGGLEPRLAINYKIDEGQSVKVSYNRLRQYVHLISNTTAATPADLWQVSTRYLLPQTGDNFSLGYYRNLTRRSWETSGEVFYKKVNNMPAYRDFAQLLLNDHIETELISGRSWSYGFEYSLRKKEGKLTGSLAYTLSRVWQQAKSEYPAISVNKGAWFPSNFDQPHQVNLFAKWASNPARFWTFNFSYRTGRPVSAPRNGYQVGSTVVPYFPARNNLRIPDYHRLDIGYTIDRTKATLEGRSWMVNFSIYNVYGRQNPFAVYFKRDKRGIPKAYQLSAIGTAIPSVNFTMNW